MWNSVTRLRADKSCGFSKEGKVHSKSKKCLKYLGEFRIFSSKTSLDVVISFPSPSKKLQICNWKRRSVLTKSNKKISNEWKPPQLNDEDVTCLRTKADVRTVETGHENLWSD